MQNKLTFVQRLDAGNDINGNPRRLFLVTQLDTQKAEQRWQNGQRKAYPEVIAIIDEGYAGYHALDDITQKYIDMGDIKIPVKEYNYYKKLQKELQSK